MTNRQWLIWKLIDMSDEELVKEYAGLMCDVCASHIVPSDEPCRINCETMLLAWLKQEHEDGDCQ